MLISEDLYDKAFVAQLVPRLRRSWPRARREYPPAVAEGLTGVPAEQIVAAARMYADGPSTFVSGHGIDAFSAGVQTFRAYHCLVAISGNVDRAGGNLRMRTPKGLRNYIDLLHMPEFRLDAETEKRTIGADRFPLWAGPKGWQTACHNPSVIEAMLTGRPYPVRALYASGVNILVTYPNTRRTIEALRSLDFVAVAAHAMTPTAEHADLVLPKTTTLEEEEVSFMPSGPTVLFTRAVVPPQGEARCEIDIAVPLLDKLAQRQAVARTSAAVALAARVQHLPAGRLRHPHRGPGADRLSPAERRAADAAPRPFATPTGKIELFSTAMQGARARPAAGLHAAEPRAPARGHGQAIPAHPHHRRPREELSPFPLPRSALGAQGLARSAAHHAPRHRARHGAGGRRLGASRGGGRQGHLPAAHEALRCDAARRGQYRHGLVAAVRSVARARRPRRQHQRRARLRRPVGPRLRLLRRARPAVPGGYNSTVISARNVRLQRRKCDVIPQGGDPRHYRGALGYLRGCPLARA